ncbi:protein HEXIM1-like [Ylistrum balloti]|uniref:protein HEXIM1-like n=1 Tax=Ylistrum balloti TaxID=509963 RepID=UPI002905E44C|nr:protein HEXIM1-like [Ylistrum balloti]
MINYLSRKMIGFESSTQSSVERMVERQTRIAMKKRKTRRGKKKKEFGSIEKFPAKYSDESCHIDCGFSSCRYCMNESIDICNRTDAKCLKDTRRKKTRQIHRPRYSLKAPHNSTQFIMDGHLKDQSFYDNFDSPEYSCDTSKTLHELGYSPNSCSDYGLDTLFRDSEIMDFGMATTDTVAFMEQDFESVMRNAQMDEISNLSKEELLKRVLVMAEKSEQLEKELEQSSSDRSFFGDNDSTLGNNISGQGYLSKLLQENVKLKHENHQLKEMLSEVKK